MSPEQLEQAIELQRKCWTHERIASELGVHRVTVSKALARHNRRALARLERRSAATRARQVAQLEWVAEQAAHGWERSLEDAETVKTGGGANGSGVETTTKGQSGNPAMLAQIREALRDIRAVLGLDKPASPADDAAKPAPCALDEADPRFVEDGQQPPVVGDPGRDAPP